MSSRTRFIMLLMFGLISVCCSKRFVKEISSKEDSEAKSANTSDFVVDDDESTDSIAQEPAIIAGGFLYCSVTEDEQWKSIREGDGVIAIAECFVGDAAKNPKQVSSPEATRFTTITAEGQPVAVTAVVISKNEITHWLLPMKTFATPWIAIATFADESQFQCEIDKGAFSPTNNSNNDVKPPVLTTSFGPDLALNGTFSQPAVGNGVFSDGSKSWDHFAPNGVNGWDAVWNNTTCTNAVRLEIQRKSGADGQQWVDLSGSCQVGVTPPAGGSNLKISQTIKTEVGASYQLSFNYFLQKARISAFRVTRPEGTLFDTNQIANLKAGVWNAATMEFAATSTETILSFAEYGSDPLEGTLLDNVSVKQIIRSLQE
ncbi:DUF642 domain-containing protein [Oligoflexus tunisiensis]|uniref:DUF642 domain-containing protein n=1 Tax=Oligoflexus tunisiensis TaxID=708132 RepID=UPI00159F0746|nr:DUF642 domain-containing protein [Oligoflexus tunisiensis]